MLRGSGILMPISSLPSNYGIGTFGKEAYKFIDFLHLSGQRYWQLLPLGPVSYGDSPYASFSIYAGNPYYIDLELLIEEGILTYDDCEILNSGDEYVDYEKQFKFRYNILYKAYKNFNNHNELSKFKQENSWVNEYSLFMALKYHFNQKPFWTFLQYFFHKQYYQLKKYANDKGVSIIGDMPIYVGEDSVEVWIEDKLFNKKLIAGVPPDAFSETGQLWGNPVYNWGYLKENFYEWWIKRLKWSFKLYDVVRIDHFRGFDEFWAVPHGSLNAVKGKWYTANGEELFENAVKELGNLNIIAEDLGIITDSVVELKNKFNFPGMKVLQFAFDGNPNNPYLPENHGENSVVYTGTHDNDTLKGWYEKLSKEQREYVLKSSNIVSKDVDTILNEIIKIVLNSNSVISIIPIQDYLLLGSEGRINTPSTLGGNWMWRINNNQLNTELAEKIKEMTMDSKRF